MATLSDHWPLLNDTNHIIDMTHLSNSEHMFALHPKKCGSNPKEAPMWSCSKRVQILLTQMADVRSARKQTQKLKLIRNAAHLH